MIPTCLFDLDGTLSDPKEGITKSIVYALQSFSIHVEDINTLDVFIGPPLLESFQTYYHFTYEDAQKAVAKYREYFVKQGLYENVLYPGIKTLLSNLKEEGIACILATSKPEPFAKSILEYFALDTYFEGICGATLDESRNKKGDVIRYAMQRYALRNYDTIMVGDRMHDILGARENDLYSIGVTYGYGSEEELREAAADRIVSTPEELHKAILQKIKIG